MRFGLPMRSRVQSEVSNGEFWIIAVTEPAGRKPSHISSLSSNVMSYPSSVARPSLAALIKISAVARSTRFRATVKRRPYAWISNIVGSERISAARP